jgi:NAD(P)-dependent dehydrogenase (short-subunit alcohol dehydrogenase family)
MASSESLSEAMTDPLSLFDVSGQVVVITGASGALGRAVGVALAAVGAKVLLVSGSADALAGVAAEARSVGGDVEQLVARPDSERDAAAMIGAAVEAFGKVDSVFVASGHNAPAPIEDMSYDEWQAVMDANVRGPWLMAQALGRHLHERDARGRLLLVSSVRGRHGNAAGYTAYCTSKGATDALTKVLATEWGRRRINVNAIAPAVFRSALTNWIFADTEAGADSRARNHARIPFGRLGEPEDFIGIALYLLSPASDFVTGQIIYVDGGYTAA